MNPDALRSSPALPCSITEGLPEERFTDRISPGACGVLGPADATAPVQQHPPEGHLAGGLLGHELDVAGQGLQRLPVGLLIHRVEARGRDLPGSAARQ
jgi:hypothetical protein